MQKKCLFLLARKYGGHLGHHAIKRDYLEQEDHRSVLNTLCDSKPSLSPPSPFRPKRNNCSGITGCSVNL